MSLKTRAWSTPLIIAISLVISVTGVMLFFHLNDSMVKGIHEWLGLGFVVVILLHVLNHWKGFKNYFNKKLAVGLMTAVITISAAFIFNAENTNHPLVKVAKQLEQNSLQSIATLQQKPVEDLEASLINAGIAITGYDQSLQQITELNGVHLFKVIGLVFAENGVK